MNKPPTKLDPETVGIEALPIYFVLRGQMKKGRLLVQGPLAALPALKGITRKSYVTAWSKTHKKKSTPAQKLAAKLKRCGVSR